MRIANKTCRALVQSCTPFKGHNLYGQRENGFYVVYSYGPHFPMWACDGKVWYENVDRYSVSTSKQKGQSNPHADSVFTCDTVELKKIIAGGVYHAGLR